MIENITRRDFSIKMVIPIAGITFLEVGCTSAQASNFINVLNIIDVSIQGVLPILSLFAGPYAMFFPAIADFVNLANTAASDTATELASSDSAIVQSRKIIMYWATVVLSPVVLAKLPTDINNVNTQALIQSLVTYINNLLSQIAATIPGATVTPAKGSNAIYFVSIPAAAAQKVFSNTKPIDISMLGKWKLHSIVKKCKKNSLDLQEITGKMAHRQYIPKPRKIPVL